MARTISTVPFSRIRAELVRWLWRGRIALGKVNLIEADGSMGKSTFIAWLAAQASRGELDGDLHGCPANVIIFSAEDNASDTIKPRLETQGADQDRVHGIGEHDPVGTIALPDDLEALRLLIVRMMARLVVFDPIASFLGPKVSMSSDASLRRAIQPLKRIAEETGAAIVLIRHLNAKRNAPAYRRGLGGAVLANIARAVWAIGLHPEDGGDPNGRRIIAYVKGNLEGRITSSVETSLDETGRLVIGPEVEITADELLAQQHRGGDGRVRARSLAEAVAWLRSYLDGREVPTLEVETAAAQQHISLRTLERARAEVGVLHRRIDIRNPDGSTTHMTVLRLPGFVVAAEPDTDPPREVPALPTSGSWEPPTERPPAPSSTPPTQDEAESDDASVRFGLLELDVANGDDERRDADDGDGPDDSGPDDSGPDGGGTDGGGTDGGGGSEPTTSRNDDTSASTAPRINGNSTGSKARRSASLRVVVESVDNPIKASPGFLKKLLSDYKLDILGLCGFGCVYCSSNWGNYLRINREDFANLTEEQLGERLYPDEEPALTFVWPDILDKLRRQLARKRPGFGRGKTLVYSMLTDGFSPELLKNGITEQALRLVLEHTEFRIRILTKNSIVGSPHWIQFFSAYRDRFVVGLSTGTLDNDWARKIEVRTSSPRARLRALARLQDAGIATFGMLCPVFPDVLEGDGLERLVDRINPTLVEHIWSEPFNDRTNWSKVRDGYETGSPGYQWMTEVYERRRMDLWSAYAAELYTRLRRKAETEGWIGKLRYLLYETDITAADAPHFIGLDGVLLQSTTGADGKTTNSYLKEWDQR